MLGLLLKTRACLGMFPLRQMGWLHSSKNSSLSPAPSTYFCTLYADRQRPCRVDATYHRCSSCWETCPSCMMELHWLLLLGKPSCHREHDLLCSTDTKALRSCLVPLSAELPEPYSSVQCTERHPIPVQVKSEGKGPHSDVHFMAQSPIRDGGWGGIFQKQEN